MMFPNTEKTETCHGNVPQILFVARPQRRRSWQKLALLFSFTNLC